MRKQIWGFVVFVFGLCIASGCGPAVCLPEAVQNCLCGDLPGKRLCKPDGSAFGVCQCEGDVDAGGPKDAVEPGQPEPRTEDAQEFVSRDESTQLPDQLEPQPDQARESTEHPQDIPTPQCPTGEFYWENKCHRNEDFCRGTLHSQTLPVFPASAVAAMEQPFALVFTPGTQQPAFCQTKAGYYYLPGSGYGKCDLDGDGWINIEAYRAITTTDAQLKANARCATRRITAIVYHAEGAAPQVQRLDKAATLVETFRNDGGTDITDLPVYTLDQKPLPKAKLGLCNAANGCAADEACYLGQCVKGRRFAPAEINTLTKACIAGLDLNDNQLDDAMESPSDTPVPSNEFKPLLSAGYFIELHYGRFEQGYIHAGSQMDVYHIHERSRLKLPSEQGLALHCQGHDDGFQPDYWKRCRLRDSQQCKDPNDPTIVKPGLNQCWLKDVQRRTPSLFKCVVHDNNVAQDKPAGFFHPANYGYLKHYNRTLCNFKATIHPNDPSRDLEFSCTADPGDRAPDPSKKEVGWACLSFRNYQQKADYLAGCVNESVEQVCGATKDGEPVRYFLLENHSYGMTRAGAPCGQSNGKGVCDKAIRICSGGTWLPCDQCSNCPQQTKGQIATCPNGTWPVGPDSCRRLQGASAEVCDGLDNDCDGQVDEGLPTLNYYLDNDKDTYGDPTKVVSLCVGRSAVGYTTQQGDCDDSDPAIKPGVTDDCDGKDNDCDGSIDEDAAIPTTTRWYKDDDQDGFGDQQGTFLTGCRQGTSSATYQICTGKGACIPLTYTHNGALRTYVSNNGDCCDKDSQVHPNQTTYFTAASNACSTPGKPFWDYNCDNQDTPDPSIPLCQCSPRSEFWEQAYSSCYTRCERDIDWGTSQSANSCSGFCARVSQNGFQKCQIDTVHTFTPNPTADMSKICHRNVGAYCVGTQVLSCPNSHSLAYGTSRYEAKTQDGSGVIPFLKSSFGSASSCSFKPDGTMPTCGSTTSKVELSNAISTPSYNKTVNVCASKVLQCHYQGTPIYWEKGCTFSHQVEYNTNYHYFKTISVVTGKTVGCR